MNVWQFLVLNFTDIVSSPAQNVIFLTNMLGLMRGVLNYAILYELEWYQKRDNSRIYEIIPPPTFQNKLWPEYRFTYICHTFNKLENKDNKYVCLHVSVSI